MPIVNIVNNEVLGGALEKLLGWARRDPDLRAVVLVGSWARQVRPADEWSDLDLLLIARHPQRYLAEIAWLDAIGETWFSFLERDAQSEPFERRVLFADGCDIDFIFCSPESVQNGFPGTPLPEILRRGWRALLDKDGLLEGLPVGGSNRPALPLPGALEFNAAVNDFWFHAAWTAKKLRRGELWTAKNCCDVYLKRLLLEMVTWQARATRGSDLDTWFSGRFLEQWADPRALQGLQNAFAHYAEADIWRALMASMALFDQLAGETAERLQCDYPAEDAAKMIAWVARCYQDGQKQPGGPGNLSFILGSG
jgi:aminoglycoside 6-adenylyltransferase